MIAVSSPACDRVVEEDRVERGAGVGGHAEAQVAHAQRGEAAGDALLHQPDALDRFHGGAAQLGLAGSNGEGQHVEDQRLGRHAILVLRDLRDALCHLQLALGGVGHALLVDRHRYGGRAIARHQRHHPVDLVAAPALERERVDDRAAGVDL